MFNLIFKILADATGFKKTVNNDLPAEAKKGGEKAGNEASKMMAAQFKAGIMRFLGAGALISMFMKASDEAHKVVVAAQQSQLGVEAYQELTKAVEKTGYSMEELVAKAKLAPKEFVAMMDEIRKSGTIVSQKDIESLDKANESMQQISVWAKIAAGYVGHAIALVVQASWGGLKKYVGGMSRDLGDMANENGMPGLGEKMVRWGVGVKESANRDAEDVFDRWDKNFEGHWRRLKSGFTKEASDYVPDASSIARVGIENEFRKKAELKQAQDAWDLEHFAMGGYFDFGTTKRGIAQPLNVPSSAMTGRNAAFTTETASLKLFREQIQATRDLGKIMENKL